MPDFGDNVDGAIFSQILEMDDEDHDFSGPLVVNFFEQADETFENMDSALENKNLDELSKLGHFLKGSSATLGFNKVRDSCQVIQQYGNKLTVDGTPEPNDKVCLGKIEEALNKIKVDMKELRKTMRDFFGNIDPE